MPSLYGAPRAPDASGRNLYSTATTRAPPGSAAATTCPSTRRNVSDTLSPPTRRSSTRSQSTPSGSSGRSTRTSPRAASTEMPRQACSIMNGAPAAHACGRHATGYAVGGSPRRRGKPQKSSGSRMSKLTAASNSARNRSSTARLSP
ncbi:hypothetical protein BURPSS13_C0002 [Burkholderia pseudomallei S13]|nr:hypothetical protein BURPSS13_C0002 [Burkholderia pseudomallei S13]